CPSLKHSRNCLSAFCTSSGDGGANCAMRSINVVLRSLSWAECVRSSADSHARLDSHPVMRHSSPGFPQTPLGAGLIYPQKLLGVGVPRASLWRQATMHRLLGT